MKTPFRRQQKQKQPQQQSANTQQNTSGHKRSKRKKSRFRRFRRGSVSKSVGAVVLNRKDQTLLVFQTQNKYWEFPKGKMENGEEELDTLRRELFEETGIRQYRLVNGFRRTMHYSFRHKGKMVRRKVVYYLIQTNDTVTISDEHTGYRWLSLDAAKSKLKHKNQEKLIDHVQALIRERRQQRSA